MAIKNLRQTHTFVTLEVQPEFFAEVAANLKDAGYDHVFDDDGMTIDMAGIALTPEAPHPKLKNKYPIVLYFENKAEADECISMIKEAHPNLIERSVKK